MALALEVPFGSSRACPPRSILVSEVEVRRSCSLWAIGIAAILLAIAPANAQQYSAEKPLGTSAQSKPDYLKNAGIDQNLNHPLPLADHFRDESGADVELGKYFGQRPVVLALVYFKCGMLCPQVLHGAAAALKQTGFHPGQQFDVLVVSIDPTDLPSDAVEAKQHFVGMLGPEYAAGVHFLTGDQPSITDLANATGFHYVRVPGPDGKLNQFAHSSVIMFATTNGRMSKYLTGIDYQPRDVRLALIESSSNHIGTMTDLVMLYCCNYSPTQGRYTVSVLRVLGLAGMASILALGGMLYLLTKKPRTHAA
jgi:protein SCO1